MPGPQKSLPSFWTRKRTGRSSPDPQDDPQPDSKKARHLMPSQSYPNDVKAMPKNEGSSTRPNNKIDLNDRLVFQFVDIHAFIPGVVLVFGVTEGGTRLLIHVSNIHKLPPSPMTSTGSIEHFMRHYQIKALSWMEIPTMKLEDIDGNPSRKLSQNQVEFFVRHDDIIYHPPEGQWSKFAPLRILSFHVESAVAPGNGAPRYQQEPIMQIGNMLKMKGDSSPYSQCIFTLNTNPGIVGAEVKSYTDESEMLLAWRDWVVDNDPDLIVGHTIGCLDLPQLILRASVLNVKGFGVLGRLKYVHTKAEAQPVNKRRCEHAPILPGRLQLDTWQYIHESRIRRTTLNKKSGRPACDLKSVSLEFLGLKKEDLSFELTKGIQLGSEDAQKLAVYCLKDAHLPLLLLECPRLQCLDESIKAARLDSTFQYMPFSKFLRNGRSRPSY